MGKNWFKAVKKALRLEAKGKKHQKRSKSQNKLGFRDDNVSNASSFLETVSQEVKLSEAESEETKHACVADIPVAAAAEATVATAEDGPETSVASVDPAVAVATVEAVPEVVESTNLTLDSNLKEELAAIRIQTAFRGYLARMALRALRGIVRLKTLLDGDSVKRQTKTTLRCMQTLAHMQSQVQAGRSRMSENLALQRQLLQKHENELDSSKVGENWDDSSQSKEQVEANLLHKQDAARRRERGLAYAFSHQQSRKNSSRSTNVTFMDPNNPHWGWSWLERWTESQPSESRSTLDKGLNNEQSSLKSRSLSVGGEITKAYTRREPIAERPSPIAKKLSRTSSHPSPFTPPSRTASLPLVTGNIKSASPIGAMQALDDDTSSTFSLKSERYRRSSVSELLVGDEESLASTPAVPSYMAPTKSAKAKARLQSPLGVEQNETSEGRSVGSAKKQLSFKEMASPKGPRRHSVSSKVNDSPVKDSEAT
ncbi:hypothetical protein IFM89_025525 [Coptis chinensis]|uniref:DUF4005 domain-containing protein n=1 Tax=Coptis chinensis TaxID=261450 RepID=A0A835LNJ5_9MAGN|nr:hypothetical protein IFM89_025525 [Coptis chinensis]